MIQVDIDEIGKSVIPPRLRSYEFNALISTYSQALKTLLVLFYEFYELKRYETSFNGQVIYLEKLLNDQFDPVNTRIRIGDSQIDGTYLYNHSELEEPVYMFNGDESEDPFYILNSEESSYTFVIYVPIGEITNFKEFRAWVDKYKMKGKKYIIIEE